MPCEMNEKELSIYNVTHEYGHMIQNELLKEAFKLNGWDENGPYSFADFNQTTQEAMLKWYTDIGNNLFKNCYDEILQIAKEIDSNVSLNDILRYGKTNYCEFFAEVFANSQLSKPNTYGKAMNIFL